MTTGNKRQTINTMAEKKFRRARNTPFDWVMVDALCGLGATQEYTAEKLLIKEGAPINPQTLRATVVWISRTIQKAHGMTYVQYCDKKEESFKLSLKQTMRKNAIESNNVTMQIWLSKQYLGYSDKLEEKKLTKQEQDTFKTSWANAAAAHKKDDKDPSAV